MLSEWHVRDEVLKKHLIPDSRVSAFIPSSEETSVAISVSGDGRMLAVCTPTRILLVDAFVGYQAAEFESPGGVLLGAFFGSDGQSMHVACTQGVFTLDLSMRQSPPAKRLGPDWSDQSHALVSCHADMKSMITVDADGKVWILDLCNNASSFNQVAFAPSLSTTATLTSDYILVASQDCVAVLARASGDVICTADCTSQVFWVDMLGDKVVARSKDAVIIWKFDENTGLKCVTLLKDLINKTSYLSATLVEFNRKHILGISTKDQAGRLILELLDLDTHTSLRKWDVSRIGVVTSLHGFTRGFVSVVNGNGPLLVWSFPRQEKMDNWMTGVPNLEACFTNLPYEEAENEFDFNTSKDKSVISRYKKATGKLFDFEPRAETFTPMTDVKAMIKMEEQAVTVTYRDNKAVAAVTGFHCFKLSDLIRKWNQPEGDGRFSSAIPISDRAVYFS